MTMISNKTRRPLSVPLPRGKTLHLSPGKTGQVSAAAIDHPALKKLIDAGEIEVLGEEPRPTGFIGSGNKTRAPSQGHTSSGTVRSSGDR